MARTRNRVRLEMTGELDEWINRLDDLGAGRLTRQEWRQATERYFARTQRAVHILSGDLISSGYTRTYSSGRDEITGEVGYTVPYAIYEFARGGNHNALRVGWQGMTRVFEEALLAGVLREFEGR